MYQNQFNTFENTAFPKINKRGFKEKEPAQRPYTGVGRDAKINPDLYYHVKEENEQLKKTKLALNKKITNLETQLANIKENIIKERRQADYRVINMGNNSDFDLQKSLYENKKLKSENDKKDLIIKGLQSNFPNKISKKKKKSQKKDELTTQDIKNDYLALIARLREQLKNSNEDKKNLIHELQKYKDGQNMSQSINYNNSYNYNNNTQNNQNREMASKIADLNTNYENATMKLSTQNKILELTKRNLEDYIDKYEKERENNRKLQAELSLLKGESEKIANYKKQLDDYKRNEIKLEEELSELRVSPFIKQAEERGNVYRNFQISEKKLADTKKELDEKENLLTEAEYKLKELERENKELKESLGLEKIEKEKYKDEALNLKISRIEREKSDKMFEDKLNQFNQFGEVDSNFTKILSLYKNQNDNLNWGNVNFIEPKKGKEDDPVFLKNENQRLKIEKNTLGRELQSTKDLLLLQQQINEDNKKLKELDTEKYKSEIKKLKQKIDELVKLLDMKNIPKEYAQDATYSKSVPLVQKSRILDDNITEFSQEETETELGINENALDIYFGECVYEEDLNNELGYSVEDMLSFFSVDFYTYETQTSDILNGKNPMFNFQLIFKVDINENFLNYLEKDKLIVEVYQLRDNVQMILGRGAIGLKELMDIEYSPDATSRVISSQVDIFYDKDDQLKIATIYYKMRMRKPLSEALKWYHEQNQLEDKKDIEREMLKSKVDQTVSEYKSLGGRVYQVKILVTKAIDLVISGPARRIGPYFYYKFYKDEERYSEVAEGNNPQFEDIATFNEIVNEEFLEYIQKESLNIYIFDSMNNIELDVTSEYEARLTRTRQQISKDCIGICSIPLQGLLINDIIQGDFPIYSMDNQRVGKLIINIIWEEIKVGMDDKLLNTMPFKSDINQDTILIKLANALKEKGLNVESAFNIFDIDQKKQISLDNFKDTLIYTLKFSTNQNEIEHLIKIIFTNQGRSKLDKIDFYKIFSPLLPGPKMSQTYNNENHINLNNNYNENSLVPNNNINENNINNKPENNINNIKENNINNKNEYSSINNINENSLNDINNSNNLNNLISTSPNIINTQINNQINQTQVPKYNALTQNINYVSNSREEFNKKKDELENTTSDRDINKIGQLVAIYKLKNGKMNYEAVDFFKYLFDKDASLGIDKKELDKGFADMNINLTEKEFNNLWKKMSNGKETIDFDSFKQFHDNYCKLSVPNNDTTVIQKNA